MVGGKNCFWTSAISFSTVTHNHMLPSTFFLLNKRQKNLCCALCGDIYIYIWTELFVLWNKIITHCNSLIGSSTGALKLVITENERQSKEPSPVKCSYNYRQLLVRGRNPGLSSSVIVSLFTSAIQQRWNNTSIPRWRKLKGANKERKKSHAFN